MDCNENISMSSPTELDISTERSEDQDTVGKSKSKKNTFTWGEDATEALIKTWQQREEKCIYMGRGCYGSAYKDMATKRSALQCEPFVKFI